MDTSVPAGCGWLRLTKSSETLQVIDARLAATITQRKECVWMKRRQEPDARLEWDFTAAMLILLALAFGALIFTEIWR
jgi:hypothetical protein